MDMRTGKAASKALSFSLASADKNQVDMHASSFTFETCTLKKKVAAVQSAENGGLGLFTELPIGAEMEMVGPGFSETTIKVRCYGQTYFIFRQDIGF